MSGPLILKQAGAYAVAPDGRLPKPYRGWQGLVRKSENSLADRQNVSVRTAKRAGKRQPSMPKFNLPAGDE